jgi:predicted signal transduction protein with EAL and GGDEF domain
MTVDTPTALLNFEQERLLDLQALNILDTESEERFDRLTRLLADALGVPIALVSLVDEDRQWFKSSCGLDVHETPRETSFCAHALREPELFIVPDATLDPRFAANPLVLGEPKIRFYAGAVLRGPAGMPVGTCCMIDRKPRVLDEREEAVLKHVAALVQRELNGTENLADLRREIEREVFRDLSTGLANDRLFRDQLERAIDAAREHQQQITVLCIRLGAVWDKPPIKGLAELDILSAAAERLLPVCRGGGTLLARRGRDLAVLLTGAPRQQALAVERIATALGEPLEARDERLDLGPVVGASLFPDDGEDARTLIDAAEAALAMPPSGGGAIRYHDAELAATAASQNRLKYDLRAAIRRDDLHMVYQPKVDAGTGAYVGAEALVRWTDQERGPVSPLQMIAAAEGSDLIHELGHWVLRSVARQIRDWRDAGLDLGPVAVNLSAVELLHPDLCSRVRGVLNEFAIAGEAIQIEVTETTLVEDFDGAADRMRELRELGIVFAIDDFGTGYSSLAYLQRLPVHYLKIDRAFVKEIDGGGDAAAIVDGIIRLAHGLRLQVIAEGVETSAQAAQLQAFGCNQIQGYFYARPLPAGELGDWIKSR